MRNIVLLSADCAEKRVLLVSSIERPVSTPFAVANLGELDAPAWADQAVTHPSHWGILLAPSDSHLHGQEAAGEHLDSCKRVQNALAWAGQAENPPKPRRGIRLDRTYAVLSLRRRQELLLQGR